MLLLFYQLKNSVIAYQCWPPQTILRHPIDTTTTQPPDTTKTSPDPWDNPWHPPGTKKIGSIKVRSRTCNSFLLKRLYIVCVCAWGGGGTQVLGMNIGSTLFFVFFYCFCHNPNSTSTQPNPTTKSWVWSENDFAPPPPTTETFRPFLSTIYNLSKPN